MSMNGHFKKITPAQLENLKNGRSSVKEFICNSSGAYLWDNSDDHLNISGVWHIIHFALTGYAWEGEPPLSNAIMGGKDIGEDLGYGPANYLEPAEVKSISNALSSLTIEKFKSNFYSPKINEQDIQSTFQQNEQDLELFFNTLRRYCLSTMTMQEKATGC